MRKKLVNVLVLAVVAFLALNLLTARKNETTEIYSFDPSTTTSGAFTVQIVGDAPFDKPVEQISNPNSGAPVGPATVSVKFPPISQRDKRQYTNDDEWKVWSPSSCSAAAMTSVLNGYGKDVRITDVLASFTEWGAITSNRGLHRYDVFSRMADKHGLKTVYSENKNIDDHLNTVMGYLRQGVPVILNVYDPKYFPGGHFVVGTGINSDGTILIMNSDPASGKSVYQNWPFEGLRSYFTRTPRSAAILPA
jgi:hypothetical protein